MYFLSLVATGLLLLAAAPAVGNPIEVSAEATGSANPPVLAQPSQTNGDFLITDPASGCNDTVGDGEDEATTWSLSLAADPDFAAFDQSPGQLTTAVLTLTLTPRPTPCTPGPAGITTDLVRIQGLADIETSTIRSLPVDATATVQVPLLGFYTEEEILMAISDGSGVLPFAYLDDAVVSFARVELVKSPSVPALPRAGYVVLVGLFSAFASCFLRRRRGPPLA